MIDYRSADFADAVSGVDVVLEVVGGDYPQRSLRVLRPGGLLVSLLPFPPGVREAAAERGVRTELLLVEADHAGMTAIADLVTAEQLRPVIAAAFPLAEVAKAHELGDTGHVAGKLVLTME